MIEEDPLGESDALWDYATDGAIPFGQGPTAELANWIGRVIYGYSAIEFQMYLNMACMSDKSSVESFQEFYAARTIHNKQNLSCLRATLLPPEFQDAHTRLWRWMRGAADRRTQVAHCVISRTERSTLGVQLVGQRALFVNLDKNRFSRTIRQFRTLQTDAHIFFAFLRLLDPERCRERLSEIPLPRHTGNQGEAVPDPAPLSPRAEVERIASLKRLGLDTVMVLDRSIYGRPTNYQLRFRGQLVL